MAYTRKTRDYWKIQGNYGYGYGWECVSPEDNLKDAKMNFKLYCENEPGVPFRIVKKREHIKGVS